MRATDERKRLAILKALLADPNQRLVRQHSVGCFVDTAYMATPPNCGGLRAAQWLIDRWMVRPLPNPHRSAEGPMVTHYTITAKGREYYARRVAL